MVDMPLIFQRLDGKDDILKVPTCVIDRDVLFLCGKRTLELWRLKLYMDRKSWRSYQERSGSMELLKLLYRLDDGSKKF